MPERFWEMVERREAGEPVAYITGRRAFWDIELHVGPGVLVPRPDSEVLIASAIEHFAGSAGPERILDLGTGPGTLLLAALDIWPDATGIGVDPRGRRSAMPRPMRGGWGSRTAPHLRPRRLGERDRRAASTSSCATRPMSPTGDELGPGVREFEPDEALFAGGDGLDAYRALARSFRG